MAITQEENAELQYSPEALETRYLYYRDTNRFNKSIRYNVFVEDTGHEYIYETIFEQLQLDVKQFQIFALGGKESVKQHFYEHGADSNGILNFYIVDGDFDRYVHREGMIDDPCFIYLRTYNIENYFIDESVCLKFVKGKMKCLEDIVRTKLNFQYWREIIVQQASDLFLCYCYVQKYCPELPNVARNPYYFIDPKTGFKRDEIDNNSYEQYANDLRLRDIEFESKKGEIKAIYESENGDDYFNLICGKFLLVSLYNYIKQVIKRNGGKLLTSKGDFEWYLVSNINADKLTYIKERICMTNYSE